MNEKIRDKSIHSAFWAFFERIANQLISFIVSVLLARLLLPDDYGIIAIVLVFFNIFEVFSVGGIGTAIVRQKDVSNKEISSVFYIYTIISFVLYLVLFLVSPKIALFYKMPILESVLRVLGLKLLFAPYNSIQRALVSRNLEFRKFFIPTFVSVVSSAVISLYLAMEGYGIWALVVQNLTCFLISAVVLSFAVKWKPLLYCSWNDARALVSFGWKFMFSGLLDVLYEDFRSLYVGKLYAPSELAFYTKGKQFPYLIVQNVTSTVSSVLLPVLSKKQDDLYVVKEMTRKAIKVTSFVLTPLIFIMATVADPLIKVILTEKWLPCVPFLQILCFNALFMPMQSCNLQALNALGKSGIVLKLNVIKKTFGFCVVLLCGRYSVLAMALGGILISINASILNSYPNKRLLDYGYLEQLRDIGPYFLLSSFVCVFVYLLSLLPFPLEVLLLMQVLLGVSLYVALSYVFRMEIFFYILNIVREKIKK
jgi:O-antigen/teichoic acid export membrane protein